MGGHPDPIGEHTAVFYRVVSAARWREEAAVFYSPRPLYPTVCCVKYQSTAWNTRVLVEYAGQLPAHAVKGR